jgi:tetrapyrrole methylase family protein/MazG family protein
MARIVVVGLGPAGADLLLPRARRVLERIAVRYVRTHRHPAVGELAADGIEFTSFDGIYDDAGSLDDVYERIADELLGAADAHGEVAYAVPGNPAVAERSVALLHERARAGRCTLDVVPGLSFADLAWARLGVDPMGGARVVDGRVLDVAALQVGGPLLVAQTDSRMVASDVKLALLDRLGPEAPVTVLQRLGLPDEHVVTVPLAELDRAVEPDHLTSVFVELPRGAGDAFGALVGLARRLRAPNGCPWDAEQTHRSLTRYLLEEAYEVVEVIEALPAGADPGGATDPELTAALVDELGDLLYQVVFHAILGEESGEFTTADVAGAIHDKLVRRHPHVFGDVEAATSDDVMRNWEQIKKDERGTDSLVDSVSPGLPALLYAHKLFRKAGSIGLDLDLGNAADTLAGAAGIVAAPLETSESDRVIGDALASVVLLARAAGVDAESALRGWAGRFRARFRRMEAIAHGRDLDLSRLEPTAVAGLWAEAGASDS